MLPKVPQAAGGGEYAPGTRQITGITGKAERRVLLWPRSAERGLGGGEQLDQARAFAERVTAKLDQIQQLVTAEQFNSIKQELDLLKAKLDEPKPRMSLIAELRSGLISGFMALPADLLAFLLGKAIGA
jgi:hypothetical protein